MPQPWETWTFVSSILVLALGRELPEELKVLILHGVLHLLGYDHETDRGEMERFEMRLRRKLGIA